MQPQRPRTLLALPMSVTSYSAKTEVVVVMALEVDESRPVSETSEWDFCLAYLLKRSFVDLLDKKFPIWTKSNGTLKNIKMPVHSSTITPLT